MNPKLEQVLWGAFAAAIGGVLVYLENHTPAPDQTALVIALAVAVPALRFLLGYVHEQADEDDAE